MASAELTESRKEVVFGSIAVGQVAEVDEEPNRLIVLFGLRGSDERLDLFPKLGLATRKGVEVLLPGARLCPGAASLLCCLLFDLPACPLLLSFIAQLEKLGNGSAGALLRCSGRGRGALRAETLQEFPPQSRAFALGKAQEQLVLTGDWQTANPGAQLPRPRSGVGIVGHALSRHGHEIGVEAKEVGERCERPRQLAEAGAAGRQHRLALIIVERAVLGTQEPAEIEAPEVAGQEVGAQGNQRREAAFPRVLPSAILIVGGELEDGAVAGGLRRRALAAAVRFCGLGVEEAARISYLRFTEILRQASSLIIT